MQRSYIKKPKRSMTFFKQKSKSPFAGFFHFIHLNQADKWLFFY